MTRLFELEGVSVRRAGEPVLSDLSAGLDEGATGLAGPSGAGKSTLLRLLNRLSEPDRGEIRYRGAGLERWDVLALRREVVLVPQLPALLPGSLAANVAYASRLAGREPSVAEMLELAGLPARLADRDVGQLSVGEQQRAMLARALALVPRVLLLDEPTSALDRASRDAIESALAGLRDELDLSLVVVTHDLAQAERLAERVLWLEAGRLREQAPAR